MQISDDDYQKLMTYVTGCIENIRAGLTQIEELKFWFDGHLFRAEQALDVLIKMNLPPCPKCKGTNFKKTFPEHPYGSDKWDCLDCGWGGIHRKRWNKWGGDHSEKEE
jgi:hypothetical protein